METPSDPTNGTTNISKESEAPANIAQSQKSTYQPHLTTTPTYRSDPVRNITSTTKTQINDEKIWSAAQQEQYLNMLKQSGFNLMANNISAGQVPFSNFSLPFTQQPNMYYYTPEMYGYYPQQWGYIQQMNPYGFVMGQHPNAPTQGGTVFNVQSVESSDSDTLEHLAAQHAAAQLYNKSIESTENTEKNTTNSEQQTDVSLGGNITGPVKSTGEDRDPTSALNTDEPTREPDVQDTLQPDVQGTLQPDVQDTLQPDVQDTLQPEANETYQTDERQDTTENDNDLISKTSEDMCNDSNNAISTRETSYEFLPGYSAIASPSESHSSSPHNNPASPSLITTENNSGAHLEENPLAFTDYSNSQDLIEWAKSLLSQPDSDDLKQIREWASVYSFVYHGRPYTDEEAVQLYIYYIQSQTNGDNSQIFDPYNPPVVTSGPESTGYNPTEDVGMGTHETATSPPTPPANPITSMKTHLEAHKKSVEAARSINSTKQTPADEPVENLAHTPKVEPSTQVGSQPQHIGDHFNISNRTTTQPSKETSNNTPTGNNKSIQISVDTSNQHIHTTHSNQHTHTTHSNQHIHTTHSSPGVDLNETATDNQQEILSDAETSSMHSEDILHSYIESINNSNDDIVNNNNSINTPNNEIPKEQILSFETHHQPSMNYLNGLNPHEQEPTMSLLRDDYTTDEETEETSITYQTNNSNLSNETNKIEMCTTPPTPITTNSLDVEIQQQATIYTTPEGGFDDTHKSISTTTTRLAGDKLDIPHKPIPTQQPTPPHTPEQVNKNPSTNFSRARDNEIHTHTPSKIRINDNKMNNTDTEHHKRSNSMLRSQKDYTHRSRKDQNGVTHHSSHNNEGRSRRKHRSRYSTSDSDSEYISKRSRRNKISSTHHRNPSKKKKKKKYSSRHHHKERDYSHDYEEIKSRSPSVTNTHEKVVTEIPSILQPVSDKESTIRAKISPNMGYIHTRLDTNDTVCWQTLDCTYWVVSINKITHIHPTYKETHLNVHTGKFSCVNYTFIIL